MRENLRYWITLAIAIFLSAVAFLVGKQTQSTTEARLDLARARKAKKQAELDKIADQAARAADDARRAALAEREKALSDETETIEATQAGLELLLARSPVDDATYAREWNRRRAANNGRD